MPRSIVYKLQDQLAYPPRAMRADRAAAYLDLPKSTFLKLVEQGTMPKPKRKGGMIRWDRLELDAAFDDLSAVAEIEAVNTFDEHFKGELK